MGGDKWGFLIDEVGNFDYDHLETLKSTSKLLLDCVFFVKLCESKMSEDEREIDVDTDDEDQYQDSSRHSSGSG